MFSEPEAPTVSRGTQSAALVFAFVVLPLLFVSWFTWLGPIVSEAWAAWLGNVLGVVVIGGFLGWWLWLIVRPGVYALGRWLSRP